MKFILNVFQRSVERINRAGSEQASGPLQRRKGTILRHASIWVLRSSMRLSAMNAAVQGSFLGNNIMMVSALQLFQEILSLISKYDKVPQ